MELSINVDGLSGRFGLEKAVKMAKNAGFNALDYFIALDDKNCQLHGENYRSIIADARRTAEKEGLRFNQTHAPFRYSVKEWNEEGNFDYFIKALEITALLGAETCIVHPLHHMEYLGHEEEIFRLNMDYYRRLIPYCKEYGVKACVENMFQIHRIRKNITFDTCSTVKEFIRYVDTLDSEYIVACLDVGHVVLPDGPDSPADFIRALGHDRLKALHIHDNDYRNDQHLVPYQGKIDWNAVTSALGEIDYTGVFTYEVCMTPFSMPDELVEEAVHLAGSIGKYLVKKVEDNRNPFVK